MFPKNIEHIGRTPVPAVTLNLGVFKYITRLWLVLASILGGLQIYYKAVVSAPSSNWFSKNGGDLSKP